MTDLLLDQDSYQDIKFSFFYSMFSFWSSGVLMLVCILSEGVAAAGSFLHSWQLLGLCAGYQLGMVLLAKLLSGHTNSLSFRLPTVTTSDNKPIRGPFLRKLWTKLSRLISKLSPLWHMCRGFTLLVACWLFLVYITVCFGAPIMSEWRETGSFCLLLTLLTVYPCLLIHGPNLSSLMSVYTCTNVSPHSLFSLHIISVATLIGGWAGAIPIPLDWDRDWQQWPISCCLGAVAGHIFGNVIAIGRVWPHMASINSGGNKRKFL